MEIVLKQANDIISKQKDEIAKAREGAELKERIRNIENEHLKERKESQRDFEQYKQQLAEKEAHMDKQYKEKCQDMKMDLQDMKKRFDDRVEDYRK